MRLSWNDATGTKSKQCGNRWPRPGSGWLSTVNQGVPERFKKSQQGGLKGGNAGGVRIAGVPAMPEWR